MPVTAERGERGKDRMLITLILGALAAAFATYAEPWVKQGLENVLLAEQRLTPPELRLFTLLACLFAAAVLSWLIGNGGAVTLTFGALLGVFGPRAIDGFRTRDRS